MSEFGANFKIVLFVVYQDHWLRSIFKKEISFPANEVSFAHLEAQMKCYLKDGHKKKCYLKHGHNKYSCAGQTMVS